MTSARVVLSVTRPLVVRHASLLDVLRRVVSRFPFAAMREDAKDGGDVVTVLSSTNESSRSVLPATMTKGAGGGVSAAFALTLSVVSSVALVIVNKHLISILGYREGACMHA